jgi:glycosyltransferase involved in cell wall biosynthesis
MNTTVIRAHAADQPTPAAGDVPWDWNVAVFCRNERWSIVHCIESIADASQQRRTLITLIVNGSSDDSAALALEAARRRGIPIAVYTIAHGDKANAINRFFHGLREPAHYYFFIDAYARIGPRSLAVMETLLAEQPDAVAATGVAANGRTMVLDTERTFTEGSRLHGQLHALRAEFVDRLVARGLRLPIGLYYGDGLVGSMALHNLDPLHNAWEQKRIVHSPDATYAIPVLSPFRLRDLKRQFQRKVRQMRGRLQNLAIRSIVYEHGYEGLPENADDMVKSYLARHGRPAVTLPDRIFQMLALRQIDAARRPDPAVLEPVLSRRT